MDAAQSQANPQKSSKSRETQGLGPRSGDKPTGVWIFEELRNKDRSDRRNRKWEEKKRQQSSSSPARNVSCFIYQPISFPRTTACYHAKQRVAFKQTSCAELWTPRTLGSVHLHRPLLGWRSASTPHPRQGGDSGPRSHLSARRGARPGPRFFNQR